MFKHEIPVRVIAPVSVAPCEPQREVLIVHGSDYGPGGKGPSFTLRLEADGSIRLKTNAWRLADGVHTEMPNAGDLSRLQCLIEDLLATQVEDQSIIMCPHAPGFTVVVPAVQRQVFTCVSQLRSHLCGGVRAWVSSFSP